MAETTIENIGQLSDREIRIIREFIKENYKEMYMKWAEKSDNGFMENNYWGIEDKISQ